MTNPFPPSGPAQEAGGVPHLQLFRDDGMNPPDAEWLLPRVARGEADAVRQCIDRYQSLVWALARRFLPDMSEAEDATQDIFLSLWQNAGRFNPTQASEKTFVAMIARRRLIDRSRRSARRPVSEPLPDTVPAPVMRSNIETDEQTARVLAAFEQLPEEARKVLKLALLSGHTHEQIATLTGIPLGTVKSHVRRGLIRVREVLDTTLTHKGGC